MKNKKIIRSYLSTCITLVLFMVAINPGILLFDNGADAMAATTDQSLYPKAYGVLASERLMYPVDMSDCPVKIDNSRQLFVDDYLIAKTDNVKRRVHKAQKHPKNPIMVPDKPWEKLPPKKSGCIFQIVRRDAKTGRFRMWYSGFNVYKLPSGTPVRFPALYAESDDGINWKKPELGLCEHNGSKSNNLIIHGGNIFGLFIDHNEPDPQARYKAVVWHEPSYGKLEAGLQPQVKREGYYLYRSPDGIRWKGDLTRCLAPNSQGYNMPQDGIGDTSIFRWDPRLKKYIGDVKFILPGKMRCRGIMESDDLIHWTRPRMTIYPDSVDDADAQIYGHLSFCYESMWLGLLRVMHTKRTPGFKQTTVELTASRDGRHWTRVANRNEILPLGGEQDWDADYHDPCWDPIVVGDELWIYYRSGRLRNEEDRCYAIGLAKLRRDGFASLADTGKPGEVITRPLSFKGKRLFINADVQPGGSIKVGLLTPDYKPVPKYSTGDCKVIKTGAVKMPVTWSGVSEFTLPEGEHVRLKFELDKAEIYAFWFE